MAKCSHENKLAKFCFFLPNAVLANKWHDRLTPPPGEPQRPYLCKNCTVAATLLVPVGWCLLVVLVGVFKIFGPLPRPPPSEGPSLGPPKISLFFFPFRSFCVSLGVFSLNFGGISKAGTLKCARLGSWAASCETLAAPPDRLGAVSSKIRMNLALFSQNHFHPKPLSSKTTFIPKPLSSNLDTFIQ